MVGRMTLPSCAAHRFFQVSGPGSETQVEQGGLSIPRSRGSVVTEVSWWMLGNSELALCVQEGVL